MKKQNKTARAAVQQSAEITPELKAHIAEWNQITSWLKKGKARENELREIIAKALFPNPKEGTNKFVGDGIAVKLGHNIKRTLDEAALDSVMEQFPEGHSARVLGNLISYSPTFDLKVYRDLSEDDRKIFDQAITIKEGSDTLEIIMAEAAAGNVGAPSPHTTGQQTSGATAQVAAAAPTKPAVVVSPSSKKPAVKFGKSALPEVQIAAHSKKVRAAKKSSIGKPAASKKPTPKKKNGRK